MFLASIMVTQTLGLFAILVASVYTLKKARAMETRLNSLALFIGSALALRANASHWLGGDAYKLLYQVGITIIIIVSMGLIVSLQNLERV